MSDGAMRLDDYDTEERFAASVASSERIASEASEAEARELVLDVERPGFSCQIGQSIGVFTPGAAEMGQQERFRLYSVSDLAERVPSGNPSALRGQSPAMGS